MAKTKPKPPVSEFYSLYAVLASTDRHPSGIEAVTVIRTAAEGMNDRIGEREKVRSLFQYGTGGSTVA